MSLRAPFPFALVIALAFGSTTNAKADELIVECKVLKVEGNRIWVTGPCDRPVSLEVSATASIIIGGKPAKLGDVPPGLFVVLTIVETEKGPIVVQIVGPCD